MRRFRAVCVCVVPSPRLLLPVNRRIERPDFCVLVVKQLEIYAQVNISKLEQKSAQYLAINPLGKIPCIQDDGFILQARVVSSNRDAVSKDSAL